MVSNSIWKSVLLIVFVSLSVAACSDDGPPKEDLQNVVTEYYDKGLEFGVSLEALEVLTPLPKESKTGTLFVGYTLRSEDDLYRQLGSTNLDGINYSFLEFVQDKGVICEGRAYIQAENYSDAWSYQVERVTYDCAPIKSLNRVRKKPIDIFEKSSDFATGTGEERFVLLNDETRANMMSVLKQYEQDMAKKVVQLKEDSEIKADLVATNRIKIRSLKSEYRKVNREQTKKISALSRQLRKEQKGLGYKEANAIAEERIGKSERLDVLASSLEKLKAENSVLQKEVFAITKEIADIEFFGKIGLASAYQMVSKD